MKGRGNTARTRYVPGSMKRSFVLSVALAWATSGCGLFGGLHVESVATSVQKPSNVAVYVAVQNGDHPAVGLFEKNFVISEDGQELAPDQTRQTLLPRDMAAIHRALLLLDLSGPLTEGDTRQRIAEAAARFVSRAHTAEPVTVYAFDGGAALRLIAEFPQGTDDIAEIPGLLTYTPSDPSSNLNSAVIEALSQLDARLMTAQKPLRVGSLIVFARGPDLAGRVPEEKMLDAIDDSKSLVFAISIKDTHGFRARRIGRAGAFEADSPESLLHAFDEAGERVADTVGRYYLLSYCSPARAGTRHLHVKVVTNDDDGKEISGSLATDFDATGFTSGCDPAERPRFVARAEPDDAKDKDRDQEKDKAVKHAPSGSHPGAAPKPDDEGDTVVPPPAKPGYAQ